MKSKPVEPRYSVGTWDTEVQSFTPQLGLSVPSLNITIHQLRQAFRELRSRGYSCHRYRDRGSLTHSDNDWSVLVERTDGKDESEILKGWER